MVAIKAYPAFKLFERAKRKIFDGLGDEEVFISKRTKGHESVEQTYKKVRLECKQGKPMTWKELYDFLSPEVHRRRWYLKNTENCENYAYIERIELFKYKLYLKQKQSVKNAKYEVQKVKCKLCGREIPEEDIVPEMQHQICYGCEVKLEFGYD